MIKTLRNLRRLLRILWVLGREDALFHRRVAVQQPLAGLFLRLLSRRAPGRPGQRLARAMTALGPTFIKAGQALSTRADLVGEPTAEDLAGLQDRLPAFGFAAVRATIEAEFGQPLEALFASFDEAPVAAASIAQVHFAVTLDGKPVAVKILRPRIEEAFQRDIEMLRWLADIGYRRFPALRRLKPRETVETFAQSVALEMDLRMEAAAAGELAENFAGDPTFNVPVIDWDRTARRVMTQARVEGIPVGDVEKMREHGIDPDAVLVKAATAFFRMAFRDGYFHADLHPGNLFVTYDGNITAVDFGIMGRIDWQTRYFLADMLLAFLNGDYRRAAEVHFEAGFVPADQSLDHFTQACRAIGEPVANRPLSEISLGRLLGQLFHTTEQFQMEAQPRLLLLQKSMLTAEGVSRSLNPDVNMWEVARPLIEEWMREHRGPEARLAHGIESGLQVMRGLPGLLKQMEKAAEVLASGRISLDDSTIAALRAKRGGGALAWAGWIATAALAAVLVWQLHG